MAEGIDPINVVEEEALTLPNNFKWDDIDLENESQVRCKVCWCQMKWV